MGDVVDIKSARGNIGGNENGRAARAEGIEGAGARVLSLVTMDRIGVNTRSLELANQPISAMFGLGEDQRALHVELVEQINEHLRLLRLHHEEELLRDAVDRARDGRHRDGDGVVQQRVGQGADFFRHGCREEHGLAIAGKQRGNAANWLDEAHVEHAVSLVENEELDFAQADEPLVEQIDQAAGSGDEDVDSLLDRAHLRALSDATKDDGQAQRSVAAVAGEAVGDLRGEFARRREDERLGLAAGGEFAAARNILKKAVDDRQREGRGFSRASLGDAQDIAGFKGRRNGLSLNRRGKLIAVGDKRIEDRLCELEAGEGGLFGRGGRHGCWQRDWRQG